MTHQRLGRGLLIAAVLVCVPVPALAGLGALPAPKLPQKPVSTTTSTVTDTVHDTVDTVGDTVHDTTDAVGDTVRGTTDAVGNTVRGTVGAVGDTLHDVTDGVSNTVGNTLQRLPRIDSVGRPPARRELIIRDPSGARAVGGQLLVLSPDAAALARARSLNFEVLSEEAIPALGLRLVTLRVPATLDTDAALAVLRAGDPEGAYEYDHLYDPSGSRAATGAPTSRRASGARGPGGAIGMIDGGVSITHPVLASARISARNCVSTGASPATEHGTEVASLLVGDGGGFAGSAPGAPLFAADVFGGAATGGDAIAIARGFGWLAEQNVVAINVSLVGPPNSVVEAAVKAVLERGVAIVAAVGNGGAAGRVEYPAGYAGVIGVTSVDETNAVQIDANRGQNVMFAARGVEVRAASASGRLTDVTGTSYAAPIVTARFSRAMTRPDRAAANATLARLQGESIDLGATGRDPVYGFGLIEERGSAVTARPASAR